MAQPEIQTEPASGVDQEAFAFVQMLAAELSKGQIELPSFPDAAIKVRQALTDEEVSIEKVQRLVSSEPALAASARHWNRSRSHGRGRSRGVSLLLRFQRRESSGGRAGLKAVRDSLADARRGGEADD